MEHGRSEKTKKTPRPMRACAIKSLERCAKQIHEMKQDSESWAAWEAYSDEEDPTYKPCSRKSP